MFGLLPGREGNEPRMCSEEGQDVQSSTGNPEISEGSPGTRQAGLAELRLQLLLQFPANRTSDTEHMGWTLLPEHNFSARAASSQRSQL